MLDIDFGRECSLRCPHCFRRKNVVDNGSPDLTYKELIDVIDQARELGLQSIKTCGAGEPTENLLFLDFIQDMTRRDVGVAVFTKGHILGDDRATMKLYSSYGISSALQLCEKLSALKVSFMLGWQSFDSGKQDHVVRRKGYTEKRDRALSNLIAAGFNKPLPTRLALCANPITRETIDEVFDVYVFARERNILPITAALMVSGKQFTKKFLDRFDVTDQEKIDLWTKIYSWNIENGIQTLEEIKDEGTSVLPGIHPCNQVACGLYITANGNVTSCPGSNIVEGNMRRSPLKEIWERSENRRIRAGCFNCLCPPKDGVTIPENLYQKVLQNLIEKYG